MHKIIISKYLRFFCNLCGNVPCCYGSVLKTCAPVWAILCFWPVARLVFAPKKRGTSVYWGCLAVFLLLFAVNFVRDGEFLAALCATGGENAAAIGGLHALTETVLVVALAVVRLECSFHCILYRYNYCFLQMLTHS